MFKISHYEVTQEHVVMEISYRFLQSEYPTVIRKTFESEEMAKDFFFYYANEYLKGAIEEFCTVIEAIKHHYFDEKAQPYMIWGDAWRTSYHILKDEMKPRFSKLIFQPFKYVEYSKLCLPVLKHLIPSFKEIGQLEIQSIYMDIESLTTKIETFMLEVKSKQSQNLQKVA